MIVMPSYRIHISKISLQLQRNEIWSTEKERQEHERENISWKMSTFTSTIWFCFSNPDKYLSQIWSIFIREQLHYFVRFRRKHREISVIKYIGRGIHKITRRENRGFGTKVNSSCFAIRSLASAQIKYHPSEIGLSSINFALTSRHPR